MYHKKAENLLCPWHHVGWKIILMIVKAINRKMDVLVQRHKEKFIIPIADEKVNKPIINTLQ
jgi:hypothetical protein